MFQNDRPDIACSDCGHRRDAHLFPPSRGTCHGGDRCACRDFTVALNPPSVR